MSSQAKAKAAKHAATTAAEAEKAAADAAHETRVGKEGTAKRNISRRKTADRDSGNYNSNHKKQGGHGKGEWKEVMDPSYADEIPIDEKDPIYDEVEDSDRYILSSSDQAGVAGGEAADKRGYDPETSKPVYGPLLTRSEFKHQLAVCLKEYFDSCDADEVIRTLQELGCQEFHAEIVKKAISLALDKHPRERELTSRLLTCMHPVPLSHDDMEKGFVLLLDSLEDLSTDVPEAPVSAVRQQNLPHRSIDRSIGEPPTLLPFIAHVPSCCGKYNVSLFFFSFRQWSHRSLPARSSTRSCLRPSCRSRTTSARATSSSRRRYRSSTGSTRRPASSAFGDQATAAPSRT